MDDKLAIREVIENWALWRDAGDWDRFATVWHDDGWMSATWFQGPAKAFIEVSRAGFEKGVSILHFLGGFTCDIAGTRAIAQTKMTINQRAAVDGLEVDVVCTGRFYDFLEKRAPRPERPTGVDGPRPERPTGVDGPRPERPTGVDGPRPERPTGVEGWGIVRRQPIYEKDRMDPVEPSRRVMLDVTLLNKFPEGYRHLAYLQSRNGFTIKDGLPGLRGEAVERLYAEGRAWLAGSERPGVPL
jgi:hypothetical protein